MGGTTAPDSPFMEAGIDSLGAVQLRNEMSAAFGIELPPTITFDYPTPAALAKFIAAQAPSGALDPGAMPADSPAAAPPGGDAAVAPPAAAAAQQPPLSVLPDIMDIVAGVVGVAVGAEDPLMASGLDSLGAVQLRNSVAERFAVELPATAALDFPTPSALAGFVAQGLAPAGGTAAAPRYADVASFSDDEAGGAGITEVLGLSCVYPGQAGAAGSGAAGFWHSALAAADLPCVIPHNRWDIDRCYSPDTAVDKMSVRFAAFIPGVEAFDAALFRLSPSEAAPMDPQGRVLLEQAHLALADAAQRSDQPVAQDCGV
jgi:acyl carrier protein